MFSPALTAALARNNFEGVRDTPDLRRVRDLPRLEWNTLVQDLKPHVLARVAKDLKPCRGGKVEDGCCSVCGTPLDLRPIQVAMLAYTHEYFGGFFTARTGAGKMLTSLLIPTMLGSKKPLLLVPASRVDPTYAALSSYKNHWKIQVPYVLSYERLSQAAYADTIVKLGPDVCTADEAQFLKDPKGSRWKRFTRWEGKCAFVPMSGSFANRSPNEWAHLAIRALGQNAPIPLDYIERQEWARALDRKSQVPLQPGALLSLSPPLTSGEIGFEAACIQFGRRLVSCPGVVSSGFDVPDIPLTCSRMVVPATTPIQEAANYLIRNWETPCGYPFDSALDLWRHLREVSTGYVQRWKTIPPQHWLTARKQLSLYYREVIDEGVYDTPGQVDIAVSDGRLDRPFEFDAWERVQGDYTIELVPVWLCESTLEYAATWLDDGGIVWTMHPAFGERLEQLTGLPYFREAGCDANGLHIEKHRGACIASVQSCGTGNNLQQFHRNLIVSCPASGLLEQVVSRTHREGQKHPVTVEFLSRIEADEKAIDGAREDAKAISTQFQVKQRIDWAEWLEDT
jgi:hypothetical protein